MLGKVILFNVLLAVFVQTASAQYFDGTPNINVNPVNNAKSYSGSNPYSNQEAQDTHGSPNPSPPNYNPPPYYD